MKMILALDAANYLIVEESFASVMADVLANSRIATIEHNAAYTKRNYVETAEQHLVPKIQFVHEAEVVYLQEEAPVELHETFPETEGNN